MEETSSEKITIEEVLLKNGKYVGPTVGVSMLPMLKNRRDSIIVLPKTERLKPLDVALYRRGKDYVLHRVLSVTEDGYIIRGDNCYANEIVPEETVIGVLSEFYRKDKHVVCTDKKYLRYAKRRVRNYPIRRVLMRLRWKLGSLKRRVLKLFKK